SYCGPRYKENESDDQTERSGNGQTGHQVEVFTAITENIAPRQSMEVFRFHRLYSFFHIGEHAVASVLSDIKSPSREAGKDYTQQLHGGFRGLLWVKDDGIHSVKTSIGRRTCMFVN
ncbi:hypothetical protein ACIONN_005327, partial [Escherichia coli]